ncbi:hypothetical protein D3C86_1949070 [compost metagenome]
MLRWLNPFDFRGREAHARMGPEANRFMTYLPGAADNRFTRLALLEYLAEAIKVHVRQVLP